MAGTACRDIGAQRKQGKSVVCGMEFCHPRAPFGAAQSRTAAPGSGAGGMSCAVRGWPYRRRAARHPG